MHASLATSGNRIVNFQVWRAYLLNASRAAVLGTISYGAWNNGAAAAEIQFHVALILFLAFAAFLISSLNQVGQHVVWPRPLLILAASWIAYAVMQMQPVNFATQAFFQGPVSIFEEFAEPGIVQATTAIEAMSQVKIAEPIPRGTVSMDETQSALLPYLIGFSYIFLCAGLFQTNQSRRALLWFFVVHAALLSFWGILQRAGGSVELLPGIKTPYDSPPFSSFIYKNAGAAAILPGLASAGLLLSLNRRMAASASMPSYKSNATTISRGDMTLLICVAVFFIAIAASLSRGAWVSAALACGFVTVVRAKGLARSLTLVAVSGLIVAVGFFATTRMSERLGASFHGRVDDLSVDAISADQRWSHWKDGAIAAYQQFPSGSGLGTYGYATLPYQKTVHQVWFREAHNQYLETAAESGLIGIAILVVTIAWLTKLSVSNLRQKTSVHRSDWACFGIVLLLLASVQSVLDFVIAIPSNLFVYCCLFTVVACRLNVASAENKAFTESHRHSNYGWSIACALSLLAAINNSQGRYVEAQTLTEIRDSVMTGEPDQMHPKMVIEKLDQAIDRSPNSSSLFLQRAKSHLTQYRHELISVATAKDVELSWDATDPVHLFEYLMTLPEQSRTGTRQELLENDELQSCMNRTLSDLSKAVELNPLKPSVHLYMSLLSPITQMKSHTWLHRSKRLSNNDAEKLFLNGFVACMLKDKPAMVDQWKRSLAVSNSHQSQILLLASERLEPLDIAKRVVPLARIEMLVDLVRITAPDPDTLNALQASGSRQIELTNQMVDYCRSNGAIPALKRSTALALLYDFAGQHGQAAEQWKEVVMAQPDKPLDRLRYTESLIKDRQYKEALDQAIVGISLFPSERRFINRIAQARRGIANSPLRVSTLIPSLPVKSSQNE